MKITINKKIIAVVLAVSMMVGVVSATFSFGFQKEAIAATFHDINQNSVFLKQSQSGRCTLASVAMLLRRAAMLNGNLDWNLITEDSLLDTAWLNGIGMKHSFTYEGMTISYGSDLDGSEEKLIDLLKEHPEGIVIYNRSLPHAFLVTDYTDGVFYCAETITYLPEGRITISQASFDVSSATCYWYVSSPKLKLDVSSNNQEGNTSDDNTGLIEETELGDLNEDGCITLVDAQIVLKLALGILSEGEKTENADLNQDGTITLIDAQNLLKKALGIAWI